MAEDLSKDVIVEKLRGAKWMMMTTSTKDGKLVPHPMVPQEVTEHADIWFFISLSGGQAAALKADPEVNIAVSEAGSWLSVSATVEFVEDKAKIQQLWNDRADTWFEGGKDDPDVGLLKVDSQSAQFWGMAGGKASSLLEIVKSKVTGERPSGSSGTVELWRRGSQL